MMPSVNSSAISSIDHNNSTNELTIVFRKTGAYTYYNVPRSVYEAFLLSKGGFFNDYIRDRY